MTETFGSSQSLNPEERHWQKQMGYEEYCLNQICKIPLNWIHINREWKHFSVQGEIVITTNFDGTLTFHTEGGNTRANN